MAISELQRYVFFRLRHNLFLIIRSISPSRDRLYGLKMLKHKDAVMRLQFQKCLKTPTFGTEVRFTHKNRKLYFDEQSYTVY